MKAGMLLKVLQSVAPDTEVSFSVGYDREYRKNLLEAVGNEPDIMSDLVASTAKIRELSDDIFKIDIFLFPINERPCDLVNISFRKEE